MSNQPNTDVTDNENQLSPAGREHREPVCGNEPIPLWLIAVAGGALFLAGIYLGIFNGGFRGDVFNERESSPALLFPEKTAAGAAATAGVATAAETESPIVRGKKFYSNPPASCVTCHQPTGKGLPGSFPPLAGSEYVQGGSKRLGMILLKGLQGPIKVQGAAFNGAMPAWEKVLNDKQIAYILTYVRQEWGNKAGEITPDQIAAARKEFSSRTEPWGEADLLAVPADAELPGGAAAAAPAAAAPEAKK
jgi:mono/diheme cytochrome c family protein